MANLTGMPISSLPETTLQEGDQVVGYRAETGKAYRTDLADQIADLTEQVNQLNQSLTDYPPLTYKGRYSGDVSSLDDIREVGDTGIYYINGLNVLGTGNSCYGYLVNMTYDAVRIQIFYPSLPLYMGAMRYYVNGAWSAWRIPTTTTV